MLPVHHNFGFFSDDIRASAEAQSELIADGSLFLKLLGALLLRRAFAALRIQTMDSRGQGGVAVHLFVGQKGFFFCLSQIQIHIFMIP